MKYVLLSFIFIACNVKPSAPVTIYDTVYVYVSDTSKTKEKIEEMSNGKWKLPKGWALKQASNGDYVVANTGEDIFEMYISKDDNEGVTHNADNILRSRDKNFVMSKAKQYFDQIDFKPVK